MYHQVGNFEVSTQTVSSLNIFHQCWLPEGEVKAVVIVVHGLGEHSGRYRNVVNTLVPQGYAIHALDHIGHGQSDGMRKYVDRFEDFISTLHTFSGLVRAQYENQPVFLLGHSMGGLIATRYLLDYQHEFSGAVLSAPALKVTNEMHPFVLWLGQLLAKILPRLRLVGLDNATLCRDPAVLDAFLNDPLTCSQKSTLRLGAEIMGAMGEVRARFAHIELPLLVLQGSGDRMVHPQGAQLLHDASVSSDNTLKVYEGWYHELFNEPECEVVLADMLCWLEQRCE